MTTTDVGFHDSPDSGAEVGKSHPLQKRRKLTMIAAGGSILCLVMLVVAAATILAHQVTTVRGQLEQAVNLVPQLRSDLEEGTAQEVQTTFDLMREQTTRARSTATGPLWTAASVIPLVGPNFRAVREVAVSADDVVMGAVAPLLGAYDSLDFQDLSPTDGQIDVTQLQEAAPSISSAADTVRLSYERLEAIERSGLLPQVVGPVQSAMDQLAEVRDALGAASSAAQLLPEMLGVEDPRKYLVLVQNSAEVRATGGIPGALAIVNTDSGRIELGEQSSAVAMGRFTPSMDVDPEQVNLYTARLGTQMQNVNLTPDFPTAAQTAKSMWEERHAGQSVDGVLSLDPGALARLLDATGPVNLTDPEVIGLIKHTSLPLSLTRDNVVPTLLSDVYREIEDPAVQDAYFAAVAGRVFAAFAEGQGDEKQVIRALTASVHEHRIYLWSSHAEEQEKIASTGLAGAVTGRDAGGATFGAYFNDGTGAKMDYYAARTVQLLQSCQTGDYYSFTVRTTVTNNAPSDAASSLPAYVTGGGAFGVVPGHIRTNHVVYGPSQSFVETATVNGEAVPLGANKHGQRPVGTVTLELGPGETAVLDVAFSRVVQDSEPRVLVTPMIASPENVILPLVRETACG